MLEADSRYTSQISSPAVSSPGSSLLAPDSPQSHDHSHPSHDQSGSKDSLSELTAVDSPGETDDPLPPGLGGTNEAFLPPSLSGDPMTLLESIEMSLPRPDDPESAAIHTPSGATPTSTSAETTPSQPDAMSRLLDSPTEVRSKPASSAYSTNTHTQAPGSEEEGSEDGLGPDVSIVLGDNLDTCIPYHVVRLIK